MKRRFIIFVLSIAFILLFVTCNKEEAPAGYTEFVIDLYSQEGIALRNVGGYQYFTGGYNGVLIIRQTTDNFIAFERACPKEHSCKVEVDPFSSLLIICPCCGTKFMSMDGSPLSGGATGAMLRKYATRFTENRYIYVSNAEMPVY